MTTQLIKYEAACTALAECKAVDEVKAWADKAAAMQAYGRMAKDRTLEVDAAEIRIRAERRLGELLAAQKAEGGLNRGAATLGVGKAGRNAVVGDDRVTPTLAQAGISKDLSSRAQKLAAVPAAEFEAELAAKRERDQQEGARVSARLEKAGERELAKQRQEPAAQPEGDERDEGDDNLLAADLLDEMQADLARAEARVAELTKALAADGKETIVKLSQQLEHAQRRQAELMEDARRWQDRADRYEKTLARIGKVIGCRDLDEVAPRVEAMVRAQRSQAAA